MQSEYFECNIEKHWNRYTSITHTKYSSEKSHFRLMSVRSTQVGAVGYVRRRDCRAQLTVAADQNATTVTRTFILLYVTRLGNFATCL